MKDPKSGRALLFIKKWEDHRVLQDSTPFCKSEIFMVFGLNLFLTSLEDHDVYLGGSVMCWSCLKAQVKAKNPVKQLRHADML